MSLADEADQSCFADRPESNEHFGKPEMLKTGEINKPFLLASFGAYRTQGVPDTFECEERTAGFRLPLPAERLLDMLIATLGSPG